MTSSTAEAQRPAVPSPWSGRLVAALPLLTVFAWLALVYAWEAWLVTTPVIFTDELLYAKIAQSVADTGHAALRGEPHSLESLAVAARAPAWLIRDAESAYFASKLVGVVAMTAAAFPAYALARLVADRRAALFAAAGTIAVPALSYSALVLEEPVAYPVATAAFLLAVLALARPSPRTIGAAAAVALVSPLVRGELIVVPVALGVAGAVFAWRGGHPERVRSHLRGWDRLAPPVAAVVAAVVAAKILDRSAEWRMAVDHPRLMLDQAFDAAGALTIGLGVLPVVAAVASLVRPAGAPRTPERRAFVTVFAAAVPAFLLYTAAKGAVVNLSRELGLEYARAGIQVNALCPGFYRTEFGEYGDPQFVATVSGFTPMGRVAAASEIRGPALFLASAASDFMTGQCLIVDGGCMAK